MADGGVAGDAFGQLPAPSAVAALEQFLDPLWTYQRRALSLRMVSPTTENGSGRARSGRRGRADGDLVDAGAFDGEEREWLVGVGRTAAAARHRARIGYQPAGQCGWRTRRRGRGGRGVMPYRSCISRSNRPAGNEQGGQGRDRGCVRSRGRCSSTRGRVGQRCRGRRCAAGVGRRRGRRSAPAGSPCVLNVRRASARASPGMSTTFAVGSGRSVARGAVAEFES